MSEIVQKWANLLLPLNVIKLTVFQLQWVGASPSDPLTRGFPLDPAGSSDPRPRFRTYDSNLFSHMARYKC